MPPGPPNGPIEYNTLKSTYGWDVAPIRPNGTSRTSLTTTSLDFFSVMCNGFKETSDNRRNCSGVYVGEVHVRYGCGGATPSAGPNFLWVLVYVYADIAMSTATTNMMTTNNCGSCSTMSGTKFLAYAGGATSASCDSASVLGGSQVRDECACPAPNSCWFCVDMWPVADSTTGDNWIGYLGKAQFSITGVNNTVAYDVMMPHLDWQKKTWANLTASGGTGSTGLTSDSASGVCMDCTQPCE